MPMLCLVLAAFTASAHVLPQAHALPEKELMEELESRLRANFTVLTRLDSLAPYFAAYRLNDTLSFSYSVNKGGVIRDKNGRSRHLNVEVRVGGHGFDNTHPLRENIDFSQWSGYQDVALPVEDDGTVLARALRVATDFAYRAARDQFGKIRANVAVRPDEGATGPDFAPQDPVRDFRPAPPVPVGRQDLDALYATLRRASLQFAGRPHLYASQIDFNFQLVRKRMVTTEGTSIAHAEALGNIGVYVETKADDGMILWLSRQHFFKSPPRDFPAETLERDIGLLMDRLDTLRNAPVMETYAGPVILENVAAAVFIHEVFGHRVEGHRQKAVDEGQTFVSKIGRPITSPAVSIEEDPARKEFGGIPLNGYYLYDDEGVRAQRVRLVEKGIFRRFLLGRSVLSDTGRSNGHGRAVLGKLPVARMGNTILTAHRTVGRAGLRDSLKAILVRSGKPYGLLIHDISGGFTYTGRDLPQSYRVEPLYITQIFADGRPDRVVRGVDMVGTPLVSLRQIQAAGDDPGVFNGYCGAESGWVPVSAVSPSLLLESVEFESRAKDQNRPPLLQPPGLEGRASRSGEHKAEAKK